MNTFCITVYIRHLLHLTASLNIIRLVDTNAVHPVKRAIRSLTRQRGQPTEYLAEILHDLEVTGAPIAENVVYERWITPNVLDRFVGPTGLWFAHGLVLDVAFDYVFALVAESDFHDSDLVFGTVESAVLIWRAQG